MRSAKTLSTRRDFLQDSPVATISASLPTSNALQEACASLGDQSTVTMIFLKLAGFSLQDRRATAASSSGTTKLTA